MRDMDISFYLNKTLPIAAAITLRREDGALCVVTELDCGFNVESFIPDEYINEWLEAGQGEKISYTLFHSLIESFYFEGFPEDARNRYYEHLKGSDVIAEFIRDYVAGNKGQVQANG